MSSLKNLGTNHNLSKMPRTMNASNPDMMSASTCKKEGGWARARSMQSSLIRMLRTTTKNLCERKTNNYMFSVDPT
jgi:hypothetical protein